MLTSALIYLMAAVIAVPIANRLGLGSVLGYLIAGVVIGPNVLHLVGEQSDVMHFAEYGVVMMLFLVGLELRPNRLWQMRRPIMGLGGLQVGLTAAAIMLVLVVFADLPWQTIVAIGLSLALSSTAIVLQTLSEKNLLKTQAGNNAFAVLLFQDIAVIPILALLPLLALGTGHGGHEAVHTETLIHSLPDWAQVSVTLLTIVLIVVAGRFVATPLFHIVANTRINELFTALALLIVVAITALMHAVGLSPALGTFLAGVVLAESEFRHQLEVDIAPFKGLLLGLFFITVGASTDLTLIVNQPVLIGTAVVTLVAIKGLVLFGLSKLFKMGRDHSVLFSVSLAQGGEFAFVLVSAGLVFAVFTPELANIITVVVALSMLLAPMLFVLYERWASRISQHSNTTQDADEFMETADVVIAGYGRFGQIVGRMLAAQGFNLTILDNSPSQVELVRRFGNTVFYGDPSRKELLHAAGAEDAKLLIVAVDSAEQALDIVDCASKHFPHLKIMARAMDRRHAYELMRRNVLQVRRETFGSALDLAVDSLKQLGFTEDSAERAAVLFSEHDEKTLHQLMDVWGDDQSYGAAVRQSFEDLEKVLRADQTQLDTSEPVTLKQRFEGC